LQAEDNVELTTMIRTNAARVLMLGALASAGWACGSSATTSELSDARKAYDDAADSPAKTYRPGELTNAREALDRAEDAHQADPGSKREARLATIAERKADNAKADGEAAKRDAAAHQREIRAERAQERADARAEQLAEQRAEARADVRADVKPEPRADVRTDVKAEPRVARRNDTGADLAKTPDPMDKERVPEQPSNKMMETHQAQRDTRAAAALQGLSQVATVKEEPRGVVITMSGGLLFPSGQSELTPIARQNLDRVADAIQQQPDNPAVSIAGYTDAQGSTEQNKRLSQKRAQAVADQLIARGVDKSRVSVSGQGESNPVADNSTADGRANNRRVEIVLGSGNDEQH
jgi:outer membrane protein OmpA-like peptidoglycan-associated protein